MLPFGLQSAPKVFTAVADAIQWMLASNGVSHSLHYLDDYILVASDPEEAARQKQTILSIFSVLGVPLEPEKLEGPSNCLTFLGIEGSLQLRLPAGKLDHLAAELRAAIGRKCMMKRELQSLTAWPPPACFQGGMSR